MDVYEPEGEGAPRLRPAFVALHGGAFKTGSKTGQESLAGLCRDLAARGYVCASINYRLEGDDPVTRGKTLRDRAVRAAEEDAAQAVRWLRDNAAPRRIDIRRIALGGRSAGAGTAMRVAYSKTGRKLKIAAVWDLSGAMRDRPDAIRRGDPPLCIIHGTNDTLVPVAAAKALAERARQVGVPYELHLLEGRGNGHVWNLNREIDGVTLLDKTVDFLHRHLKLAER